MYTRKIYTKTCKDHNLRVARFDDNYDYNYDIGIGLVLVSRNSLTYCLQATCDLRLRQTKTSKSTLKTGTRDVSQMFI